MARDGSGTYNAPQSAVVTATPISSTSYNATIADIGSALTQSLSKDGQTVPSADLPMGTYKHSNVGNGSARNHYAAAGQVQDGALQWGGTAGGTANAITLALSPAITAYVAGMEIAFLAASVNTSAVTINVNGVGLKNLTRIDTGALSGGEIAASSLCRALYDGTQWRMISTPALPQTNTGPGQRATLSSVLSGTCVLPAGGRWDYWCWDIDGTSGLPGAFFTSGVAAGGAAVGSPLSNKYWVGTAWRIS